MKKLFFFLFPLMLIGCSAPQHYLFKSSSPYAYDKAKDQHPVKPEADPLFFADNSFEQTAVASIAPGIPSAVGHPPKLTWTNTKAIESKGIQTEVKKEIKTEVKSEAPVSLSKGPRRHEAGRGLKILGFCLGFTVAFLVVFLLTKKK